ncbi:MAG: DUF3300 domain-containing protein [Bryobacteraceae bacterium]
MRLCCASWKTFLACGLFTGAATVCLAQAPYPQTQYPPQQQQPYPNQSQYPTQQQYPNQSPYPPPQQYPQQYPNGQYPPQGQYPTGQNPPPQQYPAYGQQQPPMLPPQQLDQLVSRIALYPDPLLAQVLTASTYWDQVPDAATWAMQHQEMHGDQLVAAINADRLPFDQSVMALLPFPTVLDQMARDSGWTQQLGSAVLAQRGDVMDAVQRMRQQAYDYGYLRNSQYDQVIYHGPGSIEIVPAAPGYYAVPIYDPGVVFVRPRPGFYAGTAIRFGPAVGIGASFAPWGWGGVAFGWRDHNILYDRRPWVRTWANRPVVVHPYVGGGRPHYESHRIERRDDHGRDDHGRDHDRGRDHR